MTETIPEYAARVAAAAPPLTRLQQDRLAILLGGPRAKTSSVWTDKQRQQAEDERLRLDAIRRNATYAQRISDLVLACRVCDAPRLIHEGRREFHHWEPKRPEEIIADIRRIEVPT